MSRIPANLDLGTITKQIVINKYWKMRNGRMRKLGDLTIEQLYELYTYSWDEEYYSPRFIDCAIAIKENKFQEFFEQDDLHDLLLIPEKPSERKDDDYFC